jgi:hypothetical protein
MRRGYGASGSFRSGRGADRAVSEMQGHGSVVGVHLSPQETGELSGDGGGHDRLHVLAGRKDSESSA